MADDNIKLVPKKGSEFEEITNPSGASFMGFKLVSGVFKSIRISFENMAALFGVTSEKGQSTTLVPNQKVFTDEVEKSFKYLSLDFIKSADTAVSNFAKNGIIEVKIIPKVNIVNMEFHTASYQKNATTGIYYIVFGAYSSGWVLNWSVTTAFNPANGIKIDDNIAVFTGSTINADIYTLIDLRHFPIISSFPHIIFNTERVTGLTHVNIDRMVSIDSVVKNDIGSINRYLSRNFIASSDSSVSEFAQKGFLEVKLFPKVDITGKQFHSANYVKNATTGIYTITFGLYESNWTTIWTISASFNPTSGIKIDENIVLFTGSNDKADINVLVDLRYFPALASGSYPHIIFNIEKITGLTHVNVDRLLSINGIVKNEIGSIDKYLSRNFISSAHESVSDFAYNGLLEVKFIPKGDITGYQIHTANYYKNGNGQYVLVFGLYNSNWGLIWSADAMYDPSNGLRINDNIVLFQGNTANAEIYALVDLRLFPTVTTFPHIIFNVGRITGLTHVNIDRMVSASQAKAKFYSRSVLPKELHAAVGLEFNLYHDGYNLLPEYGKGEPNFMIDVRSTWDSMGYRSYRRTPVVGDIGTHNLSVGYFNNANQIVSSNAPDEIYRTVLQVVANQNPTTQKRICIIGDSTNEGGNVAKRIYQNFQDALGIPPIMLGTRFDSTKTWKHEARTEKTYGMFANGETVVRIDFEGATFTQDDIVTLPYPKYNIGGKGVLLRHLWVVRPDGTGYAIGYNVTGMNLEWTGVATKMEGAASMPANVNVTKVSYVSGWSPFKNDEGAGNLDFGYYRTEILKLAANQKIDLMFSDLGINDIYPYGATETSINNIINNIKKLIDAFLLDNPAGIWAVCYPKSRSSAFTSSGRLHYPMRMDMQRLRERIIEEFDFNSNYPNVYVCGSGMQIDRWYGYPLAEKDVAARIPIKETKPSDDVHPSALGYQQIGDAMTATAWYLL